MLNKPDQCDQKMSSSSSSKRRKVTVDIKQTKLERGSVFARLGHKEKRKKVKPDSESASSKIKKDSSKVEYEGTEERKKTRQLIEEDESVPSKKPSKDYSRKSKTSTDESKEHKKSHRYSEDQEMVIMSETGRTHSKHKSDRGERKVENLIIEKRISPSSSLNRSRSVSPSSLSPKKKSKKHSSKHLSQAKVSDRYPDESPERPSESHKHKERGRSREKKKSSKESSKKSKEYVENEVYEAKSLPGSKHSSSKSKKAAKHGKHEKEHTGGLETEKKSTKSKHIREASDEKEKTRTKISPVVFDQSSDENYSKKHEKHEERSKAKRRKYESESVSPVRHKKAKRHSSNEEENRSYKNPSPAKHSSKKRSHKEVEVISKKKLQKEDSLTYSDYSSTSKLSQPEFSEISQTSGGNEEQYSSDYYTEKEPKKRSKTKKKTKKDADTPPSKAHYEVIDDDYSDDVKKVKKRKRKREEALPQVVESPVKEEERYREKDRRHHEATKKKVESVVQSPRMEDVRQGGHSDKYERDGHESYEHRSSPQERSGSSRRHKVQSEVKSDIRSPESSYFETRKERDRDPRNRRREQYQEPRQTRDVQHYSPERRDQGYPKSKISARHLSPERSADSKVIEWQRKTSKHLPTERKEVIPGLMSVQYYSDRRSDVPRQPPQTKYIPQRKMHESDYSYSHDISASRSGRGSLDRSSGVVDRNSDRRPPPLLPPSFSRNRSPGRVPSHLRDNRGYNEEQDRFADADRKHRRDPPQRNDSRDRKYPALSDEIRDHRVRSSSRDSRSSFRHSSIENKSKGRLHTDIGSTQSMQSPHSDRNSSLEHRDYKKPIQERLKLPKAELYERRSKEALDRTNNRGSILQDRHERGRPIERSRHVKRHLNESVRSLSPHSSHSMVKKKIGLKDSPRRRPRELVRSSSKRRSDIESERYRRPSRRREMKEQSPEIGEDEIDELIKEDKEKTPPSEVDWNELQTDTTKEDENLKETSSVLKKFSPGSILRRTGIIMDLLPQNMIDKITEIERESSEGDSVSKESSLLVGEILRNGLHSYSDERLRKHLLGYNYRNRHPFFPPRVINAKTYSASMKEYMRKMRLVEAV